MRVHAFHGIICGRSQCHSTTHVFTLAVRHILQERAIASEQRVCVTTAVADHQSAVHHDRQAGRRHELARTRATLTDPTHELASAIEYQYTKIVAIQHVKVVTRIECYREHTGQQ